ncbi:hypothetical protein B0T18DRAFT_413058 [Schizothecium vesticola]|uniref:Uncharacterized protein n=1 Tax=Schizothecium vesticola TaxID=314040 RepID=A0AA40K5V0_9PEZI|nr:hypothetical protein B0T18DRAFT_413058 [Schizothecium vesticola]
MTFYPVPVVASGRLPTLLALVSSSTGKSCSLQLVRRGSIRSRWDSDECGWVQRGYQDLLPVSQRLWMVDCSSSSTYAGISNVPAGAPRNVVNARHPKTQEAGNGSSLFGFGLLWGKSVIWPLSMVYLYMPTSVIVG